MNLWRGKATIIRLQWLVWIAVYLVIFFSLVPEDGFRQAAVYTTANTLFYALIIYGNILFLYPRIYQKGHLALYILFSVIFLILIGVVRGYLLIFLYNRFFAKTPQPINTETLITLIVAGILTYLLSFIFRIAIAWFSLKQQAEEILLQKSQAELNLLKSQVQPHFLFNTLNNIYYEAYREAPRAAALIEKLSDMMRYFVDESPKDKVSLQTEVDFLENYIALEKIRIRHEITISFTKHYQADAHIPPMLLMTFTENIFKHGIDKSSSDNRIDIVLTQRDGFLFFQTTNKIHEPQSYTASHGFGIQNLQKRLTLLYKTAFELTIDNTGDHFTAFIKIPLL